MGCILIHNQDKAVWNLASGTWVQDDEIGYTLKNTPNLRIANHVNPHFIKQLLNLPSLGTKMYPSEFLYDPETGKRLEKAQINSEEYWIPPYGHSLHYEDGRSYVDSHGLQLSSRLKKLKDIPDSISDPAPQIMKRPPRGIFEFASVKAGTGIPQLIAFNKVNGSLSIWSQFNNEWLELKASGKLLEPCPESLEASLNILGVVNVDGVEYLYIPTKAGLARIFIDAFTLSYQVKSMTQENPCLGNPVYWNRKILVPILMNDQLQIIDILTGKASIVLKNPSAEIYFEKVIYETRSVTWVGKSGQLIVKFEGDDKPLNAVYEIWLPGYTPDFRFGAPSDDGNGGFYQLCSSIYTEKGPWCYVQLNSEKPMIEKSALRFTTGHSKFHLGDKLDSGKIWEPIKSTELSNQITIPMIEDKNKQLILGFSFKDISDSIETRLEDQGKQNIVLFMDTYEGFIDFHRVQVEKPLQSRFFIHQNILYFYNPSLNDILGWELVA